jgi:hypothetical protein
MDILFIAGVWLIIFNVTLANLSLLWRTQSVSLWSVAKFRPMLSAYDLWKGRYFSFIMPHLLWQRISFHSRTKISRQARGQNLFYPILTRTFTGSILEKIIIHSSFTVALASKAFQNTFDFACTYIFQISLLWFHPSSLKTNFTSPPNVIDEGLFLLFNSKGTFSQNQ